MKKKILGLMLAGIAAVSVLAGCGGSAPSETQTEDTTAAESEAADVDSSDESGVATDDASSDESGEAPADDDQELELPDTVKDSYPYANNQEVVSTVTIDGVQVDVDGHGTPIGWYSKSYDVAGVEKNPPEEWCTDFVASAENDLISIEAKPFYMRSWHASNKGDEKVRQVIPYIVVKITNNSDMKLQVKPDIGGYLILPNGEWDYGAATTEPKADLEPGETVYKCVGCVGNPGKAGEYYVLDDDCTVFEITEMQMGFVTLETENYTEYGDMLTVTVDFTGVEIPYYYLSEQ